MKLIPLGPNQTEIETNDGQILFSYQTPVAYKRYGGGYYKTEKKWSATTTRHIKKWFCGNTAELKSQAFFDALV